MKRELVAFIVLICISSFMVFHVKGTTEKMEELINNLNEVESLIAQGDIEKGKEALQTGFHRWEDFTKYFELTHRQEELANVSLGYFSLLADIDKDELTIGSVSSLKNLLFFIAESEKPSLGAIF